MNSSTVGNIQCWFDGCCEPINPGGHASFGALIKYDDVIVFEYCDYVGSGRGMTNNVAEYSGVIAILSEIKSLLDMGISPVSSITIYGDSMLVVNQLSRRWKVKQGAYVPYYKRAVDALKDLIDPRLPEIEFIWIPREKNSECDRLSKKVLIDRGIKFRLQPEVK